MKKLIQWVRCWMFHRRNRYCIDCSYGVRRWVGKPIDDCSLCNPSKGPNDYAVFQGTFRLFKWKFRQ